MHISLDNSGDEYNGSDVAVGAVGRTGALAKGTSVFMPQMLAQHASFAVLAVRLKLSMFTSPALALAVRTAIGCGRRLQHDEDLCDLCWRRCGNKATWCYGMMRVSTLWK